MTFSISTYFEHVMVPSIRVLCTRGSIHLHQDNFSVHDFCGVQKWLSWQAVVVLND